MALERPRPTAVDCVANLLLGPDELDRALPDPSGRGVLAALEDALLPALRRPPCLVSFSGGRDSSAILATAVDVARRHDLPDPVPATMRFPSVGEADEREWQEIVLRHLGVGGARVLDLTHELDVLGPAAISFLRRDGVSWPGNAYMHLPLLELARGGSLCTGVGGDELFGSRAARHVLVARRRVTPRPRDVLSLAAAVAPRAVREWRGRRAADAALPWLTQTGRGVLARAIAREEASWPHRWDASVAHWYRSRAFRGLDTGLAGAASELDVAVVNPFLAPPVLAEMARAGGPSGFDSRAEGMRTVFGGLLPDRVLERSTKAEFTRPLWGPKAREFAAGWRGHGVDPGWVDVEALRREWLSERPDFRSILLLHQAAVASLP